MISRSITHGFTPFRHPSSLNKKRWDFVDFEQSIYRVGRYKFKKHFFPIIEDLKAQGEEFECAQVIESLLEVKYWIRNLVRRDHASFWLPLAHNRFYPDFVCELTDGRMLVVEYKGEAYVSNDDSAEKRAVGELWAKSSQGRCLFIMAVEQDSQGRDIKQQIQDMIMG